MENFGDKARAIVYALLVHVVCVGVLLSGLLWTHKTRPISLPGPVIEAELVGISAAPKPQAVSRPKPAAPKPAPPQPVEPPKPPEPNPEPPTEPLHNDRIEREKVAEIAQQAEEAKRAQEERHRQEQVLLQQQQQQERDRAKQLAQTKREREAAEKNLKLQQDKLAQLQDLQKSKPAPAQAVPEADQARTGNNGKDDSLQAQYVAAIQNAITNNWLRPDTTQPGLRCMIAITQIPGGDLLDAHVIDPCNADPLTRSSIEQAVRRAAPLPYKGYEKVFQRAFHFNFQYDG